MLSFLIRQNILRNIRPFNYCVPVLLSFLFTTNTVGEEKLQYLSEEAETRAMAYSKNFIDSLIIDKAVFTAKAIRTDTSKFPLYIERFVYKVSWGVVNAGYATISTERDSARPELLHVHVTALSNDAISAIFKVRDYLHSTIDIRGMYPLFFEEHIREGRYKANRWVLYDHAYNKAYTHSTKYPSVLIKPFTQNVISVLYYLRTRGINPQDTTIIDMLVDDKCHSTVFICRGRELVQTDKFARQCLIIEPILVGKGRVFTHKDKIRFWLTDDEYKIPLMFKVKVFFGHLSGELEWYSICKENQVFPIGQK